MAISTNFSFLKSSKNKENNKKNQEIDYSADYKTAEKVIQENPETFVSELEESTEVQPIIETVTSTVNKEKLSKKVKLNSIKDVFSHFSESDLLGSVDKIKPNLVNERKKLLTDLNLNKKKLVGDEGLRKARIDDIGMKYLFMVAMFNNLLSDNSLLKNNLELGDNLIYFRDTLEDFQKTLTVSNHYSVDNFLLLWDHFGNYFSAWDKIGLTPELLKEINLDRSEGSYNNDLLVTNNNLSDTFDKIS